MVEGVESNTWIVNVSVVTLPIGTYLPLIGSDDLGYDLSVALPPKLQLKTMELSSIIIWSPASIPWLGIVRVITPVVGL